MRLSTTAYALLGLLSFARQSGYDLVRASEHSVRHFWPISKTQVYGELRRLEEAGLVAGAAAARSGGPAKTIYELTPAGEDALDAWLAGDDPGATRLRAPVLLRVLLGHRAGGRASRRALERYRDATRERLEELRALSDRLERHPDAIYAWATAQFGVRICEAIAGWCDEVLARLPARGPRLDPRRPHPDNATALLQGLSER